MCNTCDTIQVLSRQEQNQYDPTRTLTLRNVFASNMRNRFNKLIKVVVDSIVGNDCFGLTASITTNQLNAAGNNQFNFPTSVEKSEAFMRWFREQVEQGIFETGTLQSIGNTGNNMWYNIYVFDTYKRGVLRARRELKNAGVNIPENDTDPFMGTPLRSDDLAILYSRVFSTLKGITDAMDKQISIILTRGLADGDNPRLLARKLVATIDGKGAGNLGITDSLGRFIPAKRRAEMLARTEIIRVHHQAMITEYQNWRVENVWLKAEFMTAGDDRVCPICAPREGERYTLEYARTLIPLHPGCRCIVLPYEVTKKEYQNG